MPTSNTDKKKPYREPKVRSVRVLIRTFHGSNNIQAILPPPPEK